MALHSRFILAAFLLFAGSPQLALPFQGPSSDSPVIEPRKRPDHLPDQRLNISPDLSQALLPPANLRAETSMVLVPAHVTDSIGAPVADLARENFRVFEDGVEQPITYFGREDAPVSVGFLFDSSASMRNKMRQSSEAAASFFQTANKDDEFFLVEFNERAKLSVPFTSDAKEVYERVSHVRPLGRTSLLDAVHLALVQMKRAQHARKAIVIVSDGGDNRSRYTAAQIKNAMVESEVQVYSMGIFDPEDQRKRTPEEKNGPRLLDELSEESGGKYYSVDNLDDLPAISTRIGEELRSQYLIGYSPANPERDGKYRQIKVTLATTPHKGMDVRYRRGYYAPTE
jgi:Ca-activated chloride channel family protein